jgi:hypothetical protein
MDFSNYLFRCSALGHLMSEPQGKSNLDKYNDAHSKYNQLKVELEAMKKNDAKGNIMRSWQNKSDAIDRAKCALDEAFKIKDEIQLSDGAKTHLIDIYISEKYKRKTDIQNKYIEKGLAVEEDGITIYSRLKKEFFQKNEKHLVNAFVKGTPDLFVGSTIGSADRIIDIKCSWNIFTFLRTFSKEINPIYYWQGMGYMWLTGAKYFDLAYCLVNTPYPLIESEKTSLWYKLGRPELNQITYMEGCDELEKSMTYDDIPLNEKLLPYTIERNEVDIELLKKKIIAARIYLNGLDLRLADKFKQAA